MSLQAGTKLGPYEIVGPIGAGGMGEVYRAHDSRLERDVAVKVLPVAFSTDHERLARFEQEARAVASISHPNILAVYDIGRYQPEESGPWAPYIVSELLEGETLRSRLGNDFEEQGAGRPASPLPVRKAIEYAVQIAYGLAAAHEKHIAHRDLKPENVFITKDERIKILDFGLAKLTERIPEASNSVAIETIPGIVLGSVGYMAPEQVRGLQADHQADIFALGAVLYEMLSGKRAFGGHFSEAMNAILKDHPPDLTTIVPLVPLALDRIVSRCLEKSPAARFQSAGDLAFALNALSGDSAASRIGVSMLTPSTKRGGLVREATVVLGVSLVALVGFFVAGYMRRTTIETVPPPAETKPVSPVRDVSNAAVKTPAAPAGAQALRFTIAPPPGWEATGGVAISPDGRLVVFPARRADNASGQSVLWLRSLDALAPRALQGSDHAAGLFWSPDSRFLGFFADGKIRRIDVSGGPPITLCDAGPMARSAAWSADGTIVFVGVVGGVSGLFRMPASGGAPALVTKVPQSAVAASSLTILPDGQRVLSSVASAGRARAFVTSLESGEQTPLSPFTATGPVSYSQGHLVFTRETMVMAQSFDADGVKLDGEPFPVAELTEQARLQAPGVVRTGLGGFSVSETGVLAYLTEFLGGSPQITWFDRAGHPVAPIGERADYGHVELSPDGKRAAVSAPDPVSGSRDVWIFDLARGVRTRLTFDAADDDSAVWSPDGDRIVFRSSRKGHRDLFLKASNGTGDDTELLVDDHNKTPLSWSPDGKLILFTSDEGGGHLWALPLAGNKRPQPYRQTMFREVEAQFSPGGDWVVYVSNESGRDEVYVAPFPGPGPRFQISMAGGHQPRWRRDGKEIYYVAPNNKLMAVAVNVRGSTVEAGMAQALLEVSPGSGGIAYAAGADGQRFLVSAADVPPAPTITVVVNGLVKK